MTLPKDHILRSRWVYVAIVILAIDASFDQVLEVRTLVGAIIIVLAFCGGKSSMGRWI